MRRPAVAIIVIFNKQVVLEIEAVVEALINSTIVINNRRELFKSTMFSCVTMAHMVD